MFSNAILFLKVFYLLLKIMVKLFTNVFTSVFANFLLPLRNLQIIFCWKSKRRYRYFYNFLLLLLVITGFAWKVQQCRFEIWRYIHSLAQKYVEGFKSGDIFILSHKSMSKVSNLAIYSFSRTKVCWGFQIIMTFSFWDTLIFDKQNICLKSYRNNKV